jgi:excisionase family DNA binding protein
MESTRTAPTADRLVGVPDAAASLGVAPKTVRKLVHDGRLPTVRFAPNSPYRIRVSDLERLITEGKAQ